MATLERLEPVEVEVTPILAVQVDDACRPGMAGLSQAMANAFDTRRAYLPAQGAIPAGPPRTHLPLA